MSESGAATALRWLLDLLEERGTPYQIVGGLAARAYGARRDLVDIDLYIPDDVIPTVMPDLGRYVVDGPTHYTDSLWDLTLLKLDYHGQAIEIAGADSAKFYDRQAGMWRSAGIEFDRSVRTNVMGVSAEVMPREQVIAYKECLARDVDLIDLHDIAGVDQEAATRLAVYGSLAPGEMNHHVVSGLPGAWQEGVVFGMLQGLGWGAPHGFPGLSWHPDGEPVAVAVLTSAALPAEWNRIDEFEGPEYRRGLVPVEFSGGERVLANIYLIRR